MKPEDRAVEIVRELVFFKLGNYPFDKAKQIAVFHVDGIIEAVEAFGYSGSIFDDYETGNITTTDEKDPSVYWREVKMEIEKL